MKRRSFMARSVALSLGAGLLGAPAASLAQQTAKTWRLGFMRFARYNATDSYTRDALVQRLRELGYSEDRNLAIEWRFADGSLERFTELAADLVRLKVDAIVAGGTPAALAAHKATATIPIVMLNVADPLGSGLVKSLARPGGNVTGLTDLTGEIGPKNLEILEALVPKLGRVAVLYDRENQDSTIILESIRAVARRTGITLIPVHAAIPQEIEDGFGVMRRDSAAGLLVVGGGFFTQQARQIAELAIRYRLPSASLNSPHVNAGILASYAPDTADNYRRVAGYVDRIFKGAKPSDLPVEQPTKLELVINMKTAKALELPIPGNVLARVDRVVE